MRRVVVTGLGVVSPLGVGIDAAWAAARAGRSAIARLDAPFAVRLFSPIAASAPFDGAAHFDAPRLRMLDRAAQMALVAGAQAHRDAGLDAPDDAPDPARAGVFVGTGWGGGASTEDGYRALYGEGAQRLTPLTVLAGMPSAAAGWIAAEHRIEGPCLTYTTACSSSAVAIGEAWQRIASGALDLAYAGGCEAPLSFGSLKAWEALRTVAAMDAERPWTSCRPFALDRSGMVLGEGAAMLVLESHERARARGVTIHGEVLGCGIATDFAHPTRPSVDGQARAIRAALQAAGLAPEHIDAINAHGTGTSANDAVETAAIRTALGRHADRVPVSATKAIHGHLLGAAGALEAVLSLRAMRAGVALPTMHLERPDPACDLDHVAGEARGGLALRTMLSSSFAFGGTNAVLVLGAGD